MKLELHPDWKAILTRAWSVRLIVVAGLVNFADVALGIAGQLKPSLALAVVAGVVNTAALYARLVVQRRLGGGGQQP